VGTCKVVQGDRLNVPKHGCHKTVVTEDHLAQVGMKLEARLYKTLQKLAQ